jgi:PAS domain S-box-containing protein
MLWLYLLGAVTFLVIALRRVLRRQRPLYDELYSTRVAIKHVHSGVAFVKANGAIGSVNASLADLLAAKPEELAGREWYVLFPAHEHERVREAYTQMLLSGIASLDTVVERTGGHCEPVNLRLVAVNDHKARLVGHHALIHDVSRERSLEEQLRRLGQSIGEAAKPAPSPAAPPAGVVVD